MHERKAPPANFPVRDGRLRLAATNYAEQHSVAIWIASTYFVLSLLWIWLTDLILAFFGISGGNGVVASGIKGSLFVLLSASLIYGLIRRGFQILSRANELLRAVADGTTDVVYVKDRHGRYLFVNQAAAVCVGKSVAEVLGKDDRDLFGKESAGHLQSRDQWIMSSGNSVIEEEKLEINGDVRTFLSTKSPYRNERGDVIGLTGISCDITERKRIEDERVAGERKYRELADAIPQIVWIADRDGAITLLNAKAAAFTGVPVNELTGWSWERIIHPDDLPQTVETWTEVLRTGQPCDIQFRIRRADGEYRWHIARQVPARDTSGMIVTWYGTCTDIEDFKRAKDALRDERSLLRTLIDSTPDLIFTKDCQGRYILSNLAHTAHVGVSSESELSGKTVFDFYPLEYASRYHEDDSRIFHGGESVLDREEIGCDASGLLSWRLVIKAPLKDQVGNITGLVGISRNIQTRKEREQTLRNRERILEIVTSSARVGLVVVNESYEYQFANQAYLDMVGLVESEVVGLCVSEVLSNIWPQIQPSLDQALAGQSVALELELPSDGVDTGTWMRAVFEPCVSDAGTPTVVIVVTDITERKQTEERLQAERERFQALVEQATDGFFLHDLEGNFIDVNRRGCEILGYTREELLTLGVINVDRSTEMSTVRKIWREVQPGQAATLEVQLERKDGSIIPAEVRLGCVESRGTRSILALVRDVSARKETERELRLSKFSVDRAIDAVFWIAPNSEILYANDAACRMLGVDRSKLEGQLMSDIDPNFPPNEWAEHWNELKKQGSFTFEAYHEMRDGRDLWTEVTANYLVHEGREYNCGVVRDITERKRAEQLIRESEDRYRRLMDVLPTAVFVTSGRIISFCNQAFVRLAGASSPKELLGSNLFDFIQKDDHEKVQARISLPIGSNETSSGIELHLTRLNGHPVPVHMISSLIDSNGPAFLVVLSDLTERERSMDLLRSVLASVNDAILTINENGIVKSANPATERMFGYSVENVLGNNIKMLMPSPYHEEHDGYVDAYLKTGIAKVIGIGREVEGRRIDGSTFPLELTVTEFRLDGKRNFTGVLRDNTERKRLLAQFHQSQKMEAIGRLAGGVAHDFNNLLTIINGYADLMLIDLPSQDPRRDSIAAILDAGERAARLTQQLLAFSRRAIIEPKVVDLNELAEQSVRLIRRLIGEDIALAVVLDPFLPRIKADPGQLEQVILNLVVNARDAMPSGGRLTIETGLVVAGDKIALRCPDVKQGSYARVSVSDTGCGMPDEVKANIFEPFFTTKAIGKGTGLGLAVVHGIVQQCGGAITVDSSVGEGTTFHLIFPIAVGSVVDSDAETAKLAARGTETVLLVEDEDAVRTFARIALETHGFKVLEAGRAKIALQMASEYEGPIDLLVTDVVMPEMGGRQLVESIRISRPNLRVLYMSGYTDDAVVHHGVFVAADAFIQKPFTPLSFTRKVRTVIDGPRS